MHTLPSSTNPFALMLDPQAVFAKIERSERLERLERRICRPLDKPLLGGDDAAGEVGTLAAHDMADIDGDRATV